MSKSDEAPDRGCSPDVVILDQAPQRIPEVTDLPVLEYCYFCGGETRRSKIQYRYWAGEAVVVAEGLPGYRCSRCGAELEHEAVSTEFLTAVATHLADRADPALLRSLRDGRHRLAAR